MELSGFLLEIALNYIWLHVLSFITYHDVGKNGVVTLVSVELAPSIEINLDIVEFGWLDVWFAQYLYIQ